MFNMSTTLLVVNRSQERSNLQMNNQFLTILISCRNNLALKRKDVFLSRLDELSAYEMNKSEYETSSRESIFISIADELKTVIDLSLFPEFTRRENLTFVEADFKDSRKLTELALTLLKIVFDKLNMIGSKNVKTVLKPILPDLLIFLSSNLDESLWCSTNIAVRTGIIFDMLQKLYGCSEDSLEEILFKSGCGQEYSPNSSVFGRYLQKIKTRLDQNNWMRNPNIKKSFQWILKHVKFPYLSDFINFVLPPALNFVDDFEVENKCAGINCLSHLIRNVSREELRWYGRVDVIFDALYKQLFHHDQIVIDVLHSTILLLLPVFGKFPEDIENHHKVFHVILRDVEFENKILVRRAFTTNLHNFVDILGITVLKHTKKLFQVFESYLEMYDGPGEISRVNILRTLEHFLLVAWPRVPQHTIFLSKMLFKFVYEVSTDKSTTLSIKASLISDAEKCLILIKMCDEKKMEAFLRTIEAIDMNPVVKMAITNVQNHKNVEELPNNVDIITYHLQSFS